MVESKTYLIPRIIKITQIIFDRNIFLALDLNLEKHFREFLKERLDSSVFAADHQPTKISHQKSTTSLFYHATKIIGKSVELERSDKPQDSAILVHP